MRQLPYTENPIVLRTDFSSQSDWEDICAAIRAPVSWFRAYQSDWEDICAAIGAPVSGFRAYVDFIDDVAYKDVTKEEVLRLVPSDCSHSFIILVDQVAVSVAEHPLLVVDLFVEPGREFRAVPSQIQCIENNLSIANADFADFADAVDDDGVLRSLL